MTPVHNVSNYFNYDKSLVIVLFLNKIVLYDFLIILLSAYSAHFYSLQEVFEIYKRHIYI